MTQLAIGLARKTYHGVALSGESNHGSAKHPCNITERRYLASA